MFSLNRKSLSEALSMAQSCVETKGTIPALSFALIECSDGKAEITATDLDVTLKTSIEAEGEDLSVCVPARQLAQLVKLLDEEAVSFDLKEKTGRVQVSAGSAKHLLPLLERNGFPAIEDVKGQHFVIKASMLAAMLQRTVFAINEGEGGRWNLQGVYFETKGGKFIATGSDGYRLANIKYPVPFSGEVAAIIPRKAVQAVLKAFEGEDSVTVMFGKDDRVKFSRGDTAIITRTIVGTFPNYEMIIPKEREHSFALGGKAIQIMKRAALTARTGIANNSPEIFFEVSRTGVDISSRDSEKGESADRFETECSTLNGSSIRLGIASKQLLDVLAHEPEIQFSFNNNDTQMKMSPTGLREYEYVYVMMPVRLDV